MPRKKVDKGFFIFYDWVKNLQYMEDADAWKTVCAYGEYCKNRNEDVLNKVDAHLRSSLSMMIDQAKRYRESVEQCSAAGSKYLCRNEKGQFTAITDRTLQRRSNDGPTTNTNTNTNINTNTNTSVSPQSPPRGADERLEKLFAAFWESYPRKIGKGAAHRAFRKLAPDAVLFNQMMIALELQKPSDQWTRSNGQFIPNPTTWLNECRWEDGGVHPLAPKPDAEATANPFLAYLRRMEGEGGSDTPPPPEAPCEGFGEPLMYEADFEEVMQ